MQGVDQGPGGAVATGARSSGGVVAMQMAQGMRGTWAAAVLAATLLAVPAGAAEVGGVQLEETVRVEERALRLQGSGMRKMLFWKVYAWGLYLEERPASLQAALDADRPRQLQMHLLRGVSGKQLADAIRDSFGKTAPMQLPGMQARLEELCAAVRDVRKGDRLVITYVPGQGLYVTGRVKADTFIPGKPFADALLASWLEKNELEWARGPARIAPEAPPTLQQARAAPGGALRPGSATGGSPPAGAAP